MTKNEIIGRLREAGINASSTDRSAAAYVEDAVGIRATAGWFVFRISCDSAETERRVRTVLERYYNVEISGGVWRLQSKRRLSVMAFAGCVPPTPPTPPTPTSDYLYFEAVEANSTVSMMSTLATAPNLEYSTDGVNFQEWEYTDTTEDDVTTHTFDTLTLGTIGDKVYFRGVNPAGLADFTEEGASTFVFSGKISAGGSVTSLIDNDGVTLTEIPSAGFASLFATGMITGDLDECLISPPTLGNVTIIGDYGCLSMFASCEFLESVTNMDKITQIGVFGCAMMYGMDTTISRAADMGNVTTIGNAGCSGMYISCSSVALVENGELTFQFPSLPFTAGDDTFTTAQDVADWMSQTP